MEAPEGAEALGLGAAGISIPGIDAAVGRGEGGGLGEGFICCICAGVMPGILWALAGPSAHSVRTAATISSGYGRLMIPYWIYDKR